jgi:hypothetical protein
MTELIAVRGRSRFPGPARSTGLISRTELRTLATIAALHAGDVEQALQWGDPLQQALRTPCARGKPFPLR